MFPREKSLGCRRFPDRFRAFSAVSRVLNQRTKNDASENLRINKQTLQKLTLHTHLITASELYKNRTVCRQTKFVIVQTFVWWNYSTTENTRSFLFLLWMSLNNVLRIKHDKGRRGDMEVLSTEPSKPSIFVTCECDVKKTVWSWSVTDGKNYGEPQIYLLYVTNLREKQNTRYPPGLKTFSEIKRRWSTFHHVCNIVPNSNREIPTIPPPWNSQNRRRNAKKFLTQFSSTL